MAIQAVEDCLFCRMAAESHSRITGNKAPARFPHLVDDNGKWISRNDVIYKGVISAVGQGPLKAGIQGNTIGPEMQFGHTMGYYHD